MNSIVFTATVLDGHRAAALEQQLELARRNRDGQPAGSGRLALLARVAGALRSRRAAGRTASVARTAAAR